MIGRFAGFVEWRPTEIGLGFSFSVDRDHRPPDYGARWFPNVWIHLGPLVVGYANNRPVRGDRMEVRDGR